VVLAVAAVAVLAAVALRGGGGGGDAGLDARPLAFTRFDGSTGTLGDYAGRPLVVNFFASWCEPCKRELPAFVEVHGRRGAEVAFLGVNVNDPADEGLAMAEAYGLAYDVVRDPAQELVRAVGGTRMPLTLFVTPDGRVLEAHDGELDASELEAGIDDLLEAA
jgi:thiol-disulfide isomerase/thioredoxin